jgi:hypothetical protein
MSQKAKNRRRSPRDLAVAIGSQGIRPLRISQLQGPREVKASRPRCADTGSIHWFHRTKEFVRGRKP